MPVRFDLRRCIWTGRWSDEVKQVALEWAAPWGIGSRREIRAAVLPQYEDELLRYTEHVHRYGRYLLPAVLVLCLLMAASVFLRLAWPPPACLAAMGLLFVVFPFANLPTYQITGIRPVSMFMRVTGLAMLVLGVGLLLQMG